MRANRLLLGLVWAGLSACQGQILVAEAELVAGDATSRDASLGRDGALGDIDGSVPDDDSGGSSAVDGGGNPSTRDASLQTPADAGPDATPMPPDGAVGAKGTWENITPQQVPQPWASTASFYYGWDWMDGAKADARGTLYASVDHGTGDQYSGIWKSTDFGNTWSQTNQGPNNVFRQTGAQPLVVDHTNSNVVYAGSIKTGLGLFKSTNGGTSWSAQSIIPNGIEQDVYWLSMDPHDHLHLLLTFHSAGQNWASSGNAGLLESFDGGATWPGVHQAGGWTGAGQFAFFIGYENDGSVDADGSNWLVSTQGSGLWRTENAGRNWTRAATFDMTHGMAQLYRAPNGALYTGSIGRIYRSTDNGRSWVDTGAQSTGDGYGGIVGDDTKIWAMLGNTGFAVLGPYRWQTLAIDDTSSTAAAPKWQTFGTATSTNGPAHMLYDPLNRIVYASCWGAGVMRLRL